MALSFVILKLQIFRNAFFLLEDTKILFRRALFCFTNTRGYFFRFERLKKMQLHPGKFLKPQPSPRPPLFRIFCSNFSSKYLKTLFWPVFFSTMIARRRNFGTELTLFSDLKSSENQFVDLQKSFKKIAFSPRKYPRSAPFSP